MSQNGNKPVCMYGKNCYRLQSDHFVTFSHPHVERLAEQFNYEVSNIPSESVHSSVIKQIQVLKTLHEQKKMDNNMVDENSPSKKLKLDIVNINMKLKLSNPYRFFLSSIAGLPRTHTENLTLNFQDLLCKSLGELSSSLHLNFVVDIGWLLAQYHLTQNRGVPITLLYGVQNTELETLLEQKKLPHISAANVKPKNIFGHHHTKLIIHSYKDKSIRVIVITGNLIENDWESRIQGIWISPKLPTVKDGDQDLDSPTNFKADLLRYLQCYELSLLTPWIDKIKNADFSDVTVFFISSVPGSYEGAESEKWGHRYLKKLLRDHCVIPEEDEPKRHSLIYQCSSIGSLGKSPSDWFLDDFSKSLSASRNNSSICSTINLIYPTLENVKSAYDSFIAAACLPYTDTVHARQTWLSSYLRQWKCCSRNRTKALPHIKTYCRLSHSNKSLFWFVLTSANCSKAAWGQLLSNNKFKILSYEVGLLFLPQFLIDTKKFPLVPEAGKNANVFPLPYDLPLTAYNANDIPFFLNRVS